LPDEEWHQANIKTVQSLTSEDKLKLPEADRTKHSDIMNARSCKSAALISL